MVEEDTIVGDVFVRTTYERFTLPVYMRVAHGKISLKKLVFTDCFPVSGSPEPLVLRDIRNFDLSLVISRC